MGYARVPNGTGPFQIQTPTFSATNNVTDVHQANVVQAGLRIFPNPATAEVWLDTESKAGSQPLLIRSIDGRVMLETTAESGRNLMHVDQWPSGIYVVQYGPVARKLVVQK
jgi:hypothetical protein